MNKRGITLPVSYIVVLIVMIVVLFFAFSFFFGAFDKTKKFVGNVDTETRNLINQEFLQTSERVVLPVFEKGLKKGEHYVFGLGLRNDLGQKQDFYLYTVLMSAIHEDKVEFTDNERKSSGKWHFTEPRKYILRNNEHEIIDVLINVPPEAEKGATYSFNVWAECNLGHDICKPYGYPQEIRIKVI